MFYDVTIIGQNEEKQVELVGTPTPVVVAKEDGVPEETMTNEQVLARVAELQAQLAALKGGNKVKGSASGGSANKNKVEGKPSATRKYVRIGEFQQWGKVPQQQLDLAALLSSAMNVGDEWTEEEVFTLVTEYAHEYESIEKSVQHPTYLFKYYRGLRNDGKHAGFVARNFLRVIG